MKRILGAGSATAVLALGACAAVPPSAAPGANLPPPPPAGMPSRANLTLARANQPSYFQPTITLNSPHDPNSIREAASTPILLSCLAKPLALPAIDGDGARLRRRRLRRASTSPCSFGGRRRSKTSCKVMDP